MRRICRSTGSCAWTLAVHLKVKRDLLRMVPLKSLQLFRKVPSLSDSLFPQRIKSDERVIFVKLSEEG